MLKKILLAISLLSCSAMAQVTSGFTPAQEILMRAPYDSFTLAPDGRRSGMSCRFANRGGQIKWKTEGGDWYGLGDAMRPTAPVVTYARTTFLPIGGNVSIDVTPMIGTKWSTGYGPAFVLRYAGATGTFRMHSREAPNNVGPKLSVTLADSSTVELSAIADTILANTMATGLCDGNEPIAGAVLAPNKTMVIAFPELPANAVSAVLQLTAESAISTPATIGVWYTKWPERAVVQDDNGQFIAGQFPNDANIYSHPDVIYHESFGKPGTPNDVCTWTQRTGGFFVQDYPYTWNASAASAACANPRVREPTFQLLSGPAQDPTDPDNLYWKSVYDDDLYGLTAGPSVDALGLAKTGFAELDEAWTRYYIYVSPGFLSGGDPRSLGGKMPGPANFNQFGGNGGAPAHGQAWSGRLDYLMIHDQQNPIFQAGSPGVYALYMYHANQLISYGDDLFGDNPAFITPGKWTCVEVHAKINTDVPQGNGQFISQADGVEEFWIDGKFVAGRYDLKWRMYDNTVPGGYKYNPEQNPGKKMAIRFPYWGMDHYGGKYPWGPAATNVTDPNGANNQWPNGPVWMGHDDIVVSKGGRVGCKVASVTPPPPPVNHAPTVSNPAIDRAVNVPSYVQFTIPANTFADVDGDALTYTATGLPSWLTFNAASMQFSGSVAANSTSTIVVRATDPAGEFVEDTFTLTATLPSGTAISASPSPAAAGSTVTVSWSGIVNAYYTNWFGLYVPGAPSANHNGNWMYVSCSKTAGTQVRASGTCPLQIPATLAPGAYEIRLHASGSFVDIASSTIQVIAAPVNNPPELNALNNDISATVGVLVSYQVMGFSDPGDTLTFTASGLPAWLSFDATTLQLSGTPDAAGTVTVVIRATDTGGLFIEDSIDIVTVPANSAPTVIDAIVDQSAAEDAAFTLSVATAFADADAGDVLTLSASGMPAWLSFDAGTATFSGTPAQSDVGSVSVTVRATDAAGLFVEDVFFVNVAATNDAPTVSGAIPAQSASDGAAFTLAIAADLFADVDGDTLTYTATGAPAWLTLGAGVFSGTPSVTDGGLSTVTVRATDPAGAFAETSFAVDVTVCEVLAVANPSIVTVKSITVKVCK